VLLPWRFSFRIPRRENSIFCFWVKLVAHECAHIDDLAKKQRAFPNELFEFETFKRYGTRDYILQDIAFACWGEYSACRLSADWTPENEIEILEANLRPALEGIDKRIKQYHREYPEQGDLLRLFNSVLLAAGKLAKYTSYLLGHLDGLGKKFETESPEMFALIQSSFFEPLFANLRLILQQTWDSEWASYEIFRPLEHFAENLLVAAGVLPEDTPAGLYIHVHSII
jgi:hypothetical protein